MDKIARAYLECVKNNKKLPSYSDLYVLEISKHEIRSKYVNLENLHNHIKENFEDELSKFILHEDTVFSKKKLKELNEDLKKYKRFFITTIVSGKEVDKNFLESIKNYCNRNKAKLLLLPCVDTALKNSYFSFDPIVIDENFVQSDIKLNENLFVSSIKLTAKQINPTTGLSRIGQRNGSYIFASPKQFLEYVPTNHEPDKIPHAIMTPGAITKAEYQSLKYMSDRTAYIAENDHIIGGVIVEIKNKKKFHFRQVQCDVNGSFIDLGIQYNSDNSIEEKQTSLVIEWHSGETDPKMNVFVKNICEDLKITDLYIHDGFDGRSVNHHNKDKPLIKAKNANLGYSNLQEEVEEYAKDLSLFEKWVSNEIYIVKSNHDERLQKYLIRGDYVFDPENHYYSLDLAKAYLENKDPLKEAVIKEYENYKGEYDYSRIIWLTRDNSVKISGVEMAKHGDLGANGGMPSLLSLEKSLGNCFVGHTHSAAILRGVWRIGTCTPLKLDYNTGASSWTQTIGIIYENGSRQLINNIEGEYTL